MKIIRTTWIIEPHRSWRFLDWKELRLYKDLFYFLVLRDIKIIYKQTVLGFTWAILRPLFSMIVFSVVFGRLAKVPSDGVSYPIFFYSALVPWTYFADALGGSVQSLVMNSNLITKVYFPRIFIPMTPVAAKLVDFSLAFGVWILMLLGFGVWPTWNVLWVPMMVLLMVLTAAGLGMWLSSLAIQYRDVKYGVPYLIQLLMFAAPVVWPASLIPSEYRLWYGLYPMAGVIEGFRSALLGTRLMPWDLLGMGTLTSSLIFISGLMYFRRTERIFADVV